jgi:hypothetical protein
MPRPLIRRCLLMLCAASWPSLGVAGDPQLQWHAVTPTHVAGKGWSDTAAPFDRLPSKAESVVRTAVWNLSRQSSGMCVDFETDATVIAVRWSLTSPQLAKPHMAATGVSGIDLYIRQKEGWHFAATARPTKQINEAIFARELNAGPKRCRIYLPLYNGVSSLEIGTPELASFEFADDANAKPIVFYGTSITQGGCASRPGMSYPAILGRRVDMPVINLGFSGNGKCEPEVAALLGELDASLFVIDPLPNNFPPQAAKLLPTFLAKLRRARPETPILLVGGPRYADAPAVAARAERSDDAHRVVEGIYRELVAAGDRRLYFAAGTDFTADGGEGTVDGTHPTDLGFVQMAEDLEPQIRRALATP